MTTISPIGSAAQVAALTYRWDNQTCLSVLLVTSRTRRRWIIPKGRVPAGMLPSRAEEREAFEEAGVIGRIEKVPFASYRQGSGNRFPGGSFVVQAFAMEVTGELPVWQEMRQRERRWFAIDDAIKAVEDPKIRRALRLSAQARQACL